jgi:hypothetical protein
MTILWALVLKEKGGGSREIEPTTALNGSSSRTYFVRAYTARARATRAFWPPDKLTPLKRDERTMETGG